MPAKATASVTERRFADIVASLRSKPGVTAPSSETGGGRKFGSSGLKIDNKVFAMLELLIDARGRHSGKQCVEEADLRTREADSPVGPFADSRECTEAFAPRVRQDADRTIR